MDVNVACDGDATSVSNILLRDSEVNSWYLSRQEIETNSPSRRDGMGLKLEIRLRKSYCTFLKNLGVRLKVYVSSLHLLCYLCFYLPY